MCTSKELVFSVFLIHKLAESWRKTPSGVYAILNSTRILDDYIIACYDTLHTMGTQALIEDVTDFARERGATV